MYTEDDTFRILRRTDFHEMTRLYAQWRKNNTVGYTYNTMLNLEFVKMHGWGWREFLEEKKRVRRRS